MAEVESVRYLGHIADQSATTDVAWTKTFAVLPIGLVLAVDKMNSAQQQAMVAGAIIASKLLHVCKHAWLTKLSSVGASETLYRNPALAQWKPHRRVIYQQLSPKYGGIGLPNIKAELVAMAAMTVGKWAQTEQKMQKMT